MPNKKNKLLTYEISQLFQQDPATEGDGGWQRLLIKLQKQFDESTNTITLFDDDLEKIPRYAFEYGHGGWENTLKIIFERSLGSNLGR